MTTNLPGGKDNISLVAKPHQTPPNFNLFDLEQKTIRQALNHFNHKSDAAEALGITIKCLYNKIHQYGWSNDYVRKKRG